MRYSLEIYDTDDLDTPLVNFDSDSPFLAIQAGDLLPMHAMMEGAPTQYMTVARAAHLVYGTPVKHKLMVYASRFFGDVRGALRGGNR